MSEFSWLSILAFSALVAAARASAICMAGQAGKLLLKAVRKLALMHGLQVQCRCFGSQETRVFNYLWCIQPTLV